MCHSIIDRIPIHQDEIIDLINSQKLGKASGLDCISHQMLKKTARTTSKPLSLLFEKCISEKNLSSFVEEGLYNADIQEGKQESAGKL